MYNYFKEQNNAPILAVDPHTQKHVNIEPLFLAMAETADKEHVHTPQGLGLIIADAARYLSTNVPPMEQEEVPHYREMMSRLYELQDMFDAMFVVK